MLAKRIIPSLLNKRGSLIKGRGFAKNRVIGSTLQAIRVYQSRNVDELIYLDVAADNGPDFGLIEQFASECFMPVTIGGGIRTLDHVKRLIQGGADKVSLNTAAFETPDLITLAAEKFGRQAVTVSMDVKHGTVWTRSGTHDTGALPVDHVRRMEQSGAGEILLTAIERDGTLTGYDLGLIRQVAAAVSIPVVACGGAGTYQHLIEGLDAGAHGVAAGAMWSFTDCTPAGAADYLASSYPTRRRLVA